MKEVEGGGDGERGKRSSIGRRWGEEEGLMLVTITHFMHICSSCTTCHSCLLE